MSRNIAIFFVCLVMGLLFFVGSAVAERWGGLRSVRTALLEVGGFLFAAAILALLFHCLGVT